MCSTSWIFSVLFAICWVVCGMVYVVLYGVVYRVLCGVVYRVVRGVVWMWCGVWSGVCHLWAYSECSASL